MNTHFLHEDTNRHQYRAVLRHDGARSQKKQKAWDLSFHAHYELGVLSTVRTGVCGKFQFHAHLRPKPGKGADFAKGGMKKGASDLKIIPFGV